MKWKKNPKISDVNIDFEVVGQYPPPYLSNEVEKIGRLYWWFICHV